jgi:hypothetical protein
MRPRCPDRLRKGKATMRWIFLIIAVCAVVALFGVGPEYAPYLAFFVLFANFATVCMQYDDPIRRARQRVAERLKLLKPRGGDFDLCQRLQSTEPKPTDDDRRVRYGLVTILNIATGLIATGLLVWGILLRVL